MKNKTTRTIKTALFLLIPCIALPLSVTNVFCAEEVITMPVGTYLPAGTYITGNLGLAMATDADVDNANPGESLKYDYGYAINGGLGYNFGNNMRLEAEVGYQENDLDKMKNSPAASGDTRNISLLVNGYLDFTNGGPFVTFISAGVGIANIDIDFSSTGPWGNGDDTVLGIQLGAGMGYMVNDTLTIDVKYRYFETEDVEIGDFDIDYSTHNIYVGARMSL